MKHISIGGTSFSGSTVTALMLGTADGAAAVCESNWLIPDDGSHYCHYCGPECRIWTAAFRRELEQDQSNWFPRLADRLGTDILISSEKSQNHLDRFDPEQRHTALILFKRPEDSWASIRKRRWRKETIEQASLRWKKLYAYFLSDEYNPQGGVHFLNITRMMDIPELRLPRVMGALGLSGRVEDAMHYWEQVHHYLGGNFDVYSRVKERGADAVQPRAIKPDPVAAKEFASFDDSEAEAIFARLDERCLLSGG